MRAAQQFAPSTSGTPPNVLEDGSVFLILPAQLHTFRPSLNDKNSSPQGAAAPSLPINLLLPMFGGHVHIFPAHQSLFLRR